jgi:hypothetical protein
MTGQPGLQLLNLFLLIDFDLVGIIDAGQQD